MAHDVFISYSSKDKPTADAVCAALESRGVRCWIAPRDVLPGEEYAASIVDALHSSRIMVLVFSSGANQSPQVLREVERAVSRGLPILPLRIENVPPSEAMEFYIASRHWLDALTVPLEQHLVRLCDTVKLILARVPGSGPSRDPMPSVQPVPSALPVPPIATVEHPVTAQPSEAAPKIAPRWTSPQIYTAAGVAVLLVGALVVWGAVRRHQNDALTQHHDDQNTVNIPDNAHDNPPSPPPSPDDNHVVPPDGPSDTKRSELHSRNNGSATTTSGQSVWAPNGTSTSTGINSPQPAAPSATITSATQQYAAGLADYKSGNYAQAVSWFEKAAAQGNPAAQTQLGVMYFKGDGVNKDYAQARTLFQAAAAQGNAVAENSLGLIYMNGLGADTDYAQALSWYSKAADQGNFSGLCNLGIMYENGLGVPRDKVTAYMWYLLGAQNGSPLAPKRIQILNSQLSPQQLNAAQQRAAQWRAQHGGATGQ